MTTYALRPSLRRDKYAGGEELAVDEALGIHGGVDGLADAFGVLGEIRERIGADALRGEDDAGGAVGIEGRPATLRGAAES